LFINPIWKTDETISGVTVIAYELHRIVKSYGTRSSKQSTALKKVEESNNRGHDVMESPFAFCVMKGKDA
jgi:hypothetical protein